MRPYRITLLAVALMILLCSVVSEAAIVRVARRYTLVDIFSGYSDPVGKYDGLAGLADFYGERNRPLDIDGDRLWDPTWHLGFRYGQLLGGHWQWAIGFKYTRFDQINLATAVFDDFGVTGTDSISWTAPGMFAEKDKPSVNQYDIIFDLNYQFLSMTDYPATPYLGITVGSGFTAATSKGYDSESHLNLFAAVNFGGELKLWQDGSKRWYLTLASVNSYEFYGSGDRPRYLNVGGGLRYYFRM